MTKRDLATREGTGADPRATGRRSRRKGQRGEREAAAVLRALWPGARRGAQARSGRDGADVEGTPFWVECKTHARHACFRHLEQAEGDSDGRPALVWLREDGDTRAAVLLRADVLVPLLAAAELAAEGAP